MLENLDNICLDLVNSVREELSGRDGIDINRLPKDTLDHLIESIYNRFSNILFENIVKIYESGQALTEDAVASLLIGTSIVLRPDIEISYIPVEDNLPAIVDLGGEKFLRCLNDKDKIIYISLKDIMILYQTVDD